MTLHADRSRRQARGTRSQRQGLQGETRVVHALGQGGWIIHGRRVRTPAGEVDIVAERDGILTLVEVKTGPDLTTAAYALSARQQRRLLMPAPFYRASIRTGGGTACDSMPGWSMLWVACSIFWMRFGMLPDRVLG
ncbi:YraN family protein [Acidisoma silvae]|uniref:YraN family protein n=1 Tax=Acidisoma silvae TaxID=2802396 RepID=A0A963YRI4_9PROT|nr:YraN family protein [Acidisoma silvae]MCB8875680.1 YraN family protein [Acidisoma silvae]